MLVDNRIISASFQKTQEKERKTHLSQSGGGGFQNGHFEAFLNCGCNITLKFEFMQYLTKDKFIF